MAYEYQTEFGVCDMTPLSATRCHIKFAELKVNRINVRGQASYELENGVMKLDWNTWSVYRNDTNAILDSNISDSARNKLRTELQTVVQEFFTKHPNLFKQAAKERLEDAVQSAESTVLEAEQELQRAKRQLADAKAALKNFK